MELKRLYNLRWGIESSFRALKYTVGLNVIKLSQKKPRGFFCENNPHVLIFVAKESEYSNNIHQLILNLLNLTA